MKTGPVVCLFIMVLLGNTSYCQTEVDLKLDSLSVERDILIQERAAIDSLIRVTNNSIRELQRARAEQTGDNLVAVICASSSGCDIMSGPGYYEKKTLQKVSEGTILYADKFYRSSNYLKIVYNNVNGYVYYGALQRSNAITAIMNGDPNAILDGKREVSGQSLKGSQWSAPSSPNNSGIGNTSTNNSTGSSRSTYRAIQTGPRGGKYYINSKGNKTYVKKKR